MARRPPTSRAEAAPKSKAQGQVRRRTAGTALTNPGRLLWPEQGITKQGLAEFYSEIGDWILPHVVGRPLSLLRRPEGVAEKWFLPEACVDRTGRGRAAGSRAERRRQPMLVIDDLAGLLELVQASVLEVHPWARGRTGRNCPTG